MRVASLKSRSIVSVILSEMSDEDTAEWILDMFIKNPKVMCLVESRVHDRRLFDPLITAAREYAIKLSCCKFSLNYIIREALTKALEQKYRCLYSDAFRTTCRGGILIEYWNGIHHPDNFLTVFNLYNTRIEVNPPLKQGFIVKEFIDYPNPEFQALFSPDFVVTDMNQYWSQIHPYIEWTFSEICKYYETIIRPK